MFENLTDRLSKTLRNIRGVGKLTEDNMAEALKEVHTALLSADVHFRVAREFIEAVKEKCIGQEVLKSISPGQQIIKIINDELINMLGEGATALIEEKPLRILLVGLHGSGKTTTAVKLAHHLRKKEYKPSLIACDVYRPAAIDQLAFLGEKVKIPVYADKETQKVSKLAKTGMEWATKEHGSDAIIFDTAGRLQIDTEMIDEVKALKKELNPQEILLVADSALGQEAVNVAKVFHESLGITGIILTKMDGDARGGAALSMKAITGAPIKFIGTGEKVDNLDAFHPNRMARRILGMGDVVSLVEKAQDSIEKQEADRLAKRVKKAEFDFDDFLVQIGQLKKMGSLASLAKMLPGGSKMQIGRQEETQLRQTEAIIRSMTAQERANPKLIDGSRRLRIAQGSGVEVRDVNQLLKQFLQMKKMMKSFKGEKGKKMHSKMASMSDFGDISKFM